MDTFKLLPAIEARITDDPGKARVDFGLKKNPDAKWLESQIPGIAAAQLVLDERAAALQAAPAGAAPADEIEDLGLAPVAPQPPAAEPSIVFEKIEELRPRLRVPDNATPEMVIEAALAGRWSRRAVMLCPLHAAINPWVHFAHMAMIRRMPHLGYHQETDTIIQRARNACAHAFLKSEAEWSFWVDGDTIPPFSDPAFFFDPQRLGIPTAKIHPEFLQRNALDVLVSRKKTIVGGVYQQRRRGGRIVAPLTEAKAAQIRRDGPRNELVPVEWAATGCLLVHRSVYLDIMEQRPDLAPKKEGDPWNFFGHDVATEGEDIAFCRLARECGHESFLDLAVWCAHIGNFAYIPE